MDKRDNRSIREKSIGIVLNRNISQLSRPLGFPASQVSISPNSPKILTNCCSSMGFTI
jgi:hypothetical protein